MTRLRTTRKKMATKTKIRLARPPIRRKTPRIKPINSKRSARRTRKN